ncbi:MAG: hypothetical protein AABX34_02790 [Nanoarchaeota archaeon]
MNIVSNTSPLVFLAKIGKLGFLKDYRIFIPQQVFDEILMWKNKNKDDYLILEDWINKNNVSMEKVDLLKNLPQSLGEGEKSAISLALKKKINVVLIDERKARISASVLGLKPKGTIAIIQQQMLNKKITRKECKNLVFELIKKGYRIKEELIVEFLQSIEKNN